MAPRGAGDEDLDALLPLIAEIRGAENLQVEAAALNEVRNFLWEHEAETSRSATHLLLENYPDWWVRGRRAPPGLDLQSEAACQELQRHAGMLYSLGIPLTLAERRTPVFRLFQDLEAWGTREVAPPVEDLIGPDTALTRLIGSVIAEVFPGHGGFLDAAVYDASGLSQTKGARKASLRLVWPGLLVDADRAMRVRDLLVNRLASSCAEGGQLAELEAQLKKANPANVWHSLVGDAAYGSRASVRMPLNDRVAPLPLRGPEKRPFAPVGVLRFSFSTEGKVKTEWLCREEDLDPAEWIKIGSLRQNDEAAMTEWSVPAWQGNQNIPPSAARNARVKVRTAAGSDGPGQGGGLRVRGAKPQVQPERAGQLTTVERCFTIPAAELCEKMEQHLGKAGIEPDGALVWKQPNSDARIVMYKEDQCIKVIGRLNQVRSLVLVVAPYTEAPKGLGVALDGFSVEKAPGRAPSEAFAPLGGYSAGAVGDSQDKGETGRRHTAAQDFESQGQGELALRQGDIVQVLLDPEAGAGQDRWVFGKVEASGESGWFPLSHVVPS